MNEFDSSDRVAEKRKADDVTVLEASTETRTGEYNGNSAEANSETKFQQKRNEKKPRRGKKCREVWNNHGMIKNTTVAQTNAATVAQTENPTTKLSKRARQRKNRRERKEKREREQLQKDLRENPRKKNYESASLEKIFENEVLDDFTDSIVPDHAKKVAPKGSGDEKQKNALINSPEIIDLLDDFIEPNVPILNQSYGEDKPKNAPTNDPEIIDLLDEDLEPNVHALNDHGDEAVPRMTGNKRISRSNSEKHNTNNHNGIGADGAALQSNSSDKTRIISTTNKTNQGDGTSSITTVIGAATKVDDGVKSKRFVSQGSNKNKAISNDNLYEQEDIHFDYRGSSNYEHTKSIIFLEEQVKINESTLRAWRQRRDVILVEKETAMTKKRDLMDLRGNLIDRQTSLEAARTKQLALQAELKESLAMSRERLKRLTILEKEGEIAENERKDTNVEVIDRTSPDISRKNSEEEEEETNKINQEGRNEEQTNNENNIFHTTQNKQSFPMLFDSYQNVKSLSRHHTKTIRCYPSLSVFLPYLDATQVGDYITIMLQETYALDHDTDIDGKDNDREKSFRRQLLQNTSLDALLLVPERNDNGKNVGTAAYSSSTLNLFDPNLSLCPKELEGTCNDDYCPYQHTNKTTRFLARERLPLPSLSSFLSAGPLVEPRSKTKGKPNKIVQNKKGSIQKVNIEAEKPNHNHCLLVPAKEDGPAEDGDKSSGEEDFILLPPFSPLSFEEDDSNDGTDNSSASNGDCNILVDSGKELALSHVASSTPRFASKQKPIGDNAFWWGGKLPVYRDDSVEELVPKHAKNSALSILDILEGTFGILLHENPDTSAVRTETGPSIVGKRLEIRSTLGSDPRKPKNIQFIQELKFFGRLLDATRIILHGGMYDVAFTISEELFRGTLLKFESLRSFASSLRDQTEVLRFNEIAVPKLSCFEATFATQVGLSILSYATAVSKKAEEEQSGTNHSAIHALNSACKDCWHILKNPKKIAKAFRPLDMTSLENILNNDCARKTISNKILKKCKENDCSNIDGESDPIHYESVSKRIDNCMIHNARTKIVYLRDLILKAQKDLIAFRDELDVSKQPLEERLNSIWLVAKNFLKEHRQGNLQNTKGSCVDLPIIDLSDRLDWEFKCLEVVILMGYAIIGCLKNVVRAASDVLVEPDAGDEERLGPELPNNTSNTAAWKLLDGAIVRVLKEMRSYLAGFPLVDVILAPLWACSVASATFLRSYSAAQKRLTDCLKGQYRRLDNTGDHPSVNTMAFSELLWSQLVQLRMSLPNETSTSIKARSILANNVVPKNNKLLQSNRDSSDDFPWQLSKGLKDEIRRFVAKLKSLNIYLRHVVLWGDRMISNKEGTTCSQTLLGLYCKDPNAIRLASNKSSVSIVWKDKLLKWCKEWIGSHREPPPSPLPLLPLIFLHVGKFLTHLDLNGCFLENLPLAFGLSFPNLRKLDLSGNRLRELPGSLRRLTHRMKFLEEFLARKNCLETLPSDMLLSSSSSKQSSPLRVLALSHNKLGSVPSLVGLQQLEVLELHHNALVDMTMADWSRLALRLPSLHTLEREHQAERNRPLGARNLLK